MNLPNKLTILRILFVPLLVWFLLFDFHAMGFVYALIVFVLASLTDYADGKIARCCNKITDFGKIADPLADKILVIAVLLCFVKLNIVYWVPVMLIVFREVLITVIRLRTLKKRRTALSANNLGKIKTVTQIITIIFILSVGIFIDFIGGKILNSVYIRLIYIFENILVWLCVFLSWGSGWNYIRLLWSKNEKIS